MAISFYYVDTTCVTTERRSSTIVALKARKAAHRQAHPAATTPTGVMSFLDTVFAGCAMLTLGAYAVSLVL